MSLVADYSDSSESDEDNTSQSSESEDATSPPTSAEKPSSKLPSASQVLGQKTGKGDVFSNPFLEAELNKTASLERHVKMVTNDEHLKQKNGLKICWNFRRGRCRFGTSCQYAHDSDLSVEEPGTANKPVDPSASFVGVSREVTNSKKRKHPGLGDTLEPGKRVIKNYKQHRP
ncbi:uncharacterized protein Dana_GF11138, isoform B [Drosophila ananassae]|uniref:Uncharacterized protein, isoform B n=1 Tax=Drosophila ananassae TaxID=7217 RepID=A0A0N8P0I2_DROAN|nr:uncharacterized protein LOC6494003 isoform X2 [Drosophila ananassae]KPU77196.1 uncharacterized protein Dana_GF11138, isoform B [Drosophila ananassae]